MIIPDGEREKGRNNHPMSRNFTIHNNTANSNINVSTSWNRDYDYGAGMPGRNSSPIQGCYPRHSNSSFPTSDESWQSSEDGERTPPPAYTPFDPSFAREYVRPLPRSNNRSSYHSTSNEGRRHHSTPAYSTPSSPAPGPPPSSASSSVGAPPPGVKATGHVCAHETNGSIKGAYIIDPDKSMESSGKAELTTSNGTIDVDVAVLPPSTRTGLPSRKTANLVLESSCGGIKLRLHNAPDDMVAREQRANSQRITTVRARSSNGNVHICIPRSFRGMLTANTLNGRMKLSEGIRENMTTVNSWGTEKVMFLGSTEGLPPIPPQTRDEERDGGSDGDNGPNIFIRGNNIRASTFPQGGGFFQGASNITVVGGTFNTFPGDAHVFYNKSSSNARRASRRPRATEFESRWDGSRVDAFSANGNIQVAYDDEYAFGASGAWKSEVYNSDSSRRARGGSYSNFVITGDWTAWTGIMGSIF